jgi:hypothetical protein
MRLLNRHGGISGLRGRVRHQDLPRSAAKAPPASFLIFTVETRPSARGNSSGGQNFAEI